MIRFSAWLAVICGVILIGVETLLYVGGSPFRPDYAIEYVAAALLVGSGLMMLFNVSPGRRILTGAWGFTGGIASMRFLTILSQAGLVGPDGETGVSPDLVASIGALFCLAAIGFAFSVVPDQRRPRKIFPPLEDTVDRPGSLVPDERLTPQPALHATPSVVMARDRDLSQAVHRDHRSNRVDRAARA
jgi:hypothetical protein